MCQNNKGLFIILLFSVFLSPINIKASESSLNSNNEEIEQRELTDEDKVNYIRWFGAYDDQLQTPIEELQRVFETLVNEGSTEMNKEVIIELIGEPAESFEVGASEFLVYYSINDEESDILYIQIFSEKKATEANEAQIEPVEDNDVRAPYLSEVNLIIVSKTDFQPLNITPEVIKTWQDAAKEDREFSTIEELIERIGEPSELTYNFEEEIWRFAWIRNSEQITSLNYVAAEVDDEGNLQILETIEETEEDLESVEYSSLSESITEDETFN